MPNVTVEIHCDEQGQYSVGIEPEGQEQDQASQQMAPPLGADASQESDYLKPVKSLEEALQVARDLLQGQNGQQAQQAEQDFSKGFQGPNAGGY